MTLFDANPYVNHPALWPPADDSVMSQDEAAELLGWTAALGEPMSTPLGSWDVPLTGEGSGSW